MTFRRYLYLILREVFNPKPRMPTQAELAVELRAIRLQQEKSAVEIKTQNNLILTQKARIEELEDSQNDGGEATQELVEAVAAVKVQSKTLDDLIDDEKV